MFDFVRRWMRGNAPMQQKTQQKKLRGLPWVGSLPGGIEVYSCLEVDITATGPARICFLNGSWVESLTNMAVTNGKIVLLMPRGGIAEISDNSSITTR